MDTPFIGPTECFEVMRSFDGVRGAMKMIHPFDFRVKAYGGDVWLLRASHYYLSATNSGNLEQLDANDVPSSTGLHRC